jgi:hypothetical protein
MSDNVCSAIDSLEKEMLPDDDPVRLKHAVKVF